MVEFHPFKAWRPAPDQAAEISAVPYDVVDLAEARAIAGSNPLSLLHVTRPEIDLPDGTSPHSEAAYARAREAFEALLAAGGLRQDDAAAFYVYALRMGRHRQIGVVGLASAEDYDADRVRKHEHTRPDKEDDRARHVETLGAHLGPVFLTYRSRAAIDRCIATLVDARPETELWDDNKVHHAIWPVTDPDTIDRLREAFAKVPALYIADGHHRAAAAARVARETPAVGAPSGFLAVAFPDDQLQILPYNRVVADLAGHTADSLCAALETRYTITPVDRPVSPGARGSFGMYLDGRWYRLRWRATAAAESGDPVDRLDVTRLQDHALAPLLGVEDPRRDARIGFVGGIRGTQPLVERVNATGGVAFTFHPTALDDLMAIADAGRVMPPKSTWFEPKLRSGLVVNRFRVDALV